MTCKVTNNNWYIKIYKVNIDLWEFGMIEWNGDKMKKVVDNPRLHSILSENILYHPSLMGPDGSILEPARIGWISNFISLMDGFSYFFISLIKDFCQ